MKKTLRLLAIIMSLLMVFAMFAGCGGDSTAPAEEPQEEPAQEPAQDADGAIDMLGILDALFTTEKDLGIEGKYGSTADVTDGAIDPDLVGTWYTADGDTVCTYNEDGTYKTEMISWDMVNEDKYTTEKIGNYNILIVDTTATDYSDDEPVETPAVSFTAYKVQNDVLYTVYVQDDNIDPGTRMTSVIVMYKADENGDYSKAVENNPVSLASFNGTWTGEVGENTYQYVFEDGKLTAPDGSVYDAAIKNGRLALTKDGTETTYGYGFALKETYGDDVTVPEDIDFALSLSYEGADENDKPNLGDYIEDWHTAYGYEQFYYLLNVSRDR